MAYVESDGDFREMLTTLMTADTWRYRQNPIGGDSPMIMNRRRALKSLLAAN